MAGHGVQLVDDFSELLEEMLQRAGEIKQTPTVEPPLNKPDFADLLEHAQSILSTASSPDSKKHIVETSVRDIFNTLLATTTINSPSFVKLWNLLDIVSIFSDEAQTEPGLLFWLVEELLDSETIAGCRKIFDYLESRRERITAKDFPLKKLVILRSCNELLRRLSRAEDTAFCGRVFIFMFQSFPLGDKSSVNLRGEYHVENVTTFDVLAPHIDTPETMDVDTDSVPKPPSTNAKDTPNSIKKPSEDNSKGVSFSRPEKPIPVDQLYPMFWALQQNFNQPKKLFDKTQFTAFKAGLEATMVMFKSVQSESNMRPSKAAEDVKRGTKRKRGQGDDDLANAFNPKYLTSRDLFELEISDLSFRRHILVQVLIVLDFLLSLSTKAKEKLAKAKLPDNANKSVMYADQTLSEEDSKWALETKKSIADYLKQGLEGAFFYRMVETVLSRDKNWARWKIENCPSIAKPAVTPKEYVEAKAVAHRHASKRIRQSNASRGLLDLGFLAEGNSGNKLDRLKEKSRYQLPSVEEFEVKIADDDFDIETATNQKDEESKNIAIEAKFSKSWRALRIATTNKLVLFDKIDKADKIDEIFKDQANPDDPIMNGDDETGESEELLFPKNRRPIVISGPSGVGKGTLVKMLLDKHAKVIGKKASHTTRKPREGEIDGTHYYFIDKEKYDMMRDGDQFLEFNNFNGNDYGTSRKVVQDIVDKGKVPIMEMDYHGIQQLKDQNFAARFIFLAPPEIPELERRLHQRGLDDAKKIQERLEIAKAELEQAKVEGFHDMTFVNDDLETTYKSLETYIFGFDKSLSSQEVAEIAVGASDYEVEMTNGSTPTVK